MENISSGNGRQENNLYLKRKTSYASKELLIPYRYIEYLKSRTSHQEKIQTVKNKDNSKSTRQTAAKTKKANLRLKITRKHE